MDTKQGKKGISGNLSGHACFSQQIYNVEETLQFIHDFLTTQ